MIITELLAFFLLSNLSLFSSRRLDRKIEFPLPNEEARAHMMRIYSCKMNVNQDVNFEELSRCTEDFNGAQCKAVCLEAVSCNIIPLIIQHSFNISLCCLSKGMIALRRGATDGRFVVVM